MTNNTLGFIDFLVWVIALGLISYQLFKKYSPTVALAFAWVSFTGLIIFQTAFNSLPSDLVIRFFDFSAQSATLSLLLTVGAVTCFELNTWKMIFKIVALIGALLIFTDMAFHIHTPAWGILLNGSMSGCLGAAIFPLFSRKEKWMRVIVGCSVLATGRSQPVALLFAALAIPFWMEGRVLMTLALSPVFVAIGYFLKGHLLFDSDGRAYVWKETFHYFKDNVSPLVGAGLGSFYMVGISITHGMFTWLHSDWGQILFETGAVGLLVITAMFGEALYRSRKNPALFTALVTFGLFGIANMPLRYPLAGLYGAFLIRWAFEKRKIKTGMGSGFIAQVGGQVSWVIEEYYP